MKQAAPRDKSTMFVTVMCIFLFSFFLILAAYLLTSGAVFSEIIPFLIVNTVLASILVYYFFSATIAYEVDGSNLKIIRRRKPIVFPLNEIENVRIVHKEDLGASFRIGANGGVFGYSGLIFSKNLGDLSVYLNSFEKDLILIHFWAKKTPILIHPENGVSFLVALTKPGK